MDVLFHGDLSVSAVITQSNGLIFPFLESILFDLLDPDSGGVALVIFVVNGNGLVVRVPCLVILSGGKFLAVTGFALCDALTVVSVLVALHNKVFSATLTLAET
ncbi:MAG: hypothetical protein IKT47_08055, partial [Oscillospiraceae bacterium]|nr:hypothetical protein [Oscillospiraceae bacterium]